MLRGIQNAFSTRMPKSPDPGKRSKQENLIGCNGFDCQVNAIFGSLHADRVNFVELIDWCEFVELRAPLRDLRFRRWKCETNCEQKEARCKQETCSPASANAQKLQRHNQRHEAQERTDKPEVDESAGKHSGY